MLKTAFQRSHDDFMPSGLIKKPHNRLDRMKAIGAIIFPDKSTSFQTHFVCSLIADSWYQMKTKQRVAVSNLIEILVVAGEIEVIKPKIKLALFQCSDRIGVKNMIVDLCETD